MILGFVLAFAGILMATASWQGRTWFVDSRKDDQLVLWIGEEGAQRLDVVLGLCFALGGLMIGLG
jgi:hypothetical protein